MPSVLSLSSSSSSSPSSSDSLATADDCARLPNVTGAVRSALSRSILALAAARTSAIRLSASAFSGFCPAPSLRAPPSSLRRRAAAGKLIAPKKKLHASSRSARHPAASSRVFRREGLYTHKSQPTDGTHSRRRASRSLAPLRAYPGHALRNTVPLLPPVESNSVISPCSLS